MFIGVLTWIYYRALLKRKFNCFLLKNKVFGSTVCVVAFLLAFYSIYHIDPLKTEDKKESQDTIIRLESIKSGIYTSNREEKGLYRLPTTLKELYDDDYTYTLRNGKPTGIEYTKLSDTKYELCANLDIIFCMKDNEVHILAVMASLGTFVFLAGSLISGLIICYSLIEILLPEIDSFPVSGFEYGFGIFFALSHATAFFIVFFPLYIYSSRHMQRAIKRQLQVGR